MNNRLETGPAVDIAFVFNDIRNHQSLLSAFRPGVEVHVLDASGDGLAQIAAIIAGRDNIGALHILSHGAPGALQLGTVTLDAASVSRYAPVLERIGASLTADGDILLYGCDLASGELGTGFVTQVARATRADIAASVDATGGDVRGANWLLEYHYGDVTSETSFQSSMVRGLDTLLVLPTAGLQDVTATMTVDDFIPGFTLASTSALVSDPTAGMDGLYFYSETDEDLALKEGTITVSADSLNLGSFDLKGMVWHKYSGGIPGAFLFTVVGHKPDGTTITETFHSSSGEPGFDSPPDFGGFEGIVKFTVTIYAETRRETKPEATGYPISNWTFDSFTIDRPRAPNVVTTFAGAETTLSVSQGAGATDVTGLVRVNDSDDYQTLTWSQETGPSHGTLSFSGATAAGGGTSIGPAAGAITYAPAAGYVGTDTFTIKVYDGFKAVTKTITVTVNPARPGMPDLSSASDSGQSSTDNVTNAATLAFSGTGAAGDSTSTVRVFLDVNGNGAYDVGVDASATATMSNGAWSASFASTAIADGIYNVYARTTNAGVDSALSDPLSVRIDKTAPTLAIKTSKASLKVGESATISFEFSEDPGASFSMADIAVSGGTLSGLTTTGSTRTATFTPTANANGTASITVGANSYTDAAGNNGGAGAVPGITYDTKAPTLSIASNKTSLKVGDTAAITFTFSEDPGSSFDAGDIVVSGGTLSALGGSGLTRTATFTPNAGTNSGTATITVASGAYTDSAGNGGAAAASPVLSFDTQAPATPTALAIAAGSDTGVAGDGLTSDATPTLTGTTDAGATVTLYDTDGVTVIGTGTAGGDGKWSITASALADGAHTVTAEAVDAAGNPSSRSGALPVNVDTAAPALTIASNAASLKAGETAAITFTFTEDPGASFGAGSVTVSGGTLGAITGSGLVRTASFTPALGASGTASVSVAAGAYTDKAGNAGAAGTAVSMAYDTAPPTLEITSNVASLKIGGTAVITFGFSEDPGSSFTSGDVSVDGGTLGGITGTGLTRTAVFTPAAGTNGGVATIAVASGAYLDAAGNPGGAGNTLNLTFDTLAPVAPSAPDLETGSDSGLSNIDNVTANTTPTFSGTAEAGTTVRLYDGATEIGSVTADGSGNWRITTGALAAGAHSIHATATDSAGNPSVASAALSITVDTAPPTLTISSDKDKLKVGETATITFSFSEDPGTTFTWDGGAGDVVVSGGTLGAISGTGMVRTALFTPAADSNGTASITVAAGKYTDAAGNAGNAGATPSLAFDTAAPAVSITADKDKLKIGESATITFTFTEDPNSSFTWDGAAGDIVVTGGTLSAISGTGLTRTATFTPAADTDGGVASITIGAGTYFDAAGNGGRAGVTPTLTFDTLAPAAPATPDMAAASDSGASDTDNVTADETPSFTGTAEAGAIVRLYDGATEIGSATADGAGTWTITASSLSNGLHGIRSQATDAAGNTGPASGALSVTVDTAGPALAIASDKDKLKIGESATITFTFSEDPGTSFSWNGTAGDIVVTGGTLSAISGTGTVRTAVFTADENSNGTAGITVHAGAYADAAGNGGTAGATPVLAFDTTAPGLTISSDKGALKSGEMATITFAFSEDPGSSFTWDGTAGDIEVTGGTLSALSGTGLTRTATFTPAPGSNGGVAVIKVAAGAYTDPAGNPGGAGLAPALVFDTLAPAAPLAPSLAPAYDSGASDSDRITNASDPVLTGSAEAGASVTVYDGLTVLGTVVAGADGAWSFTATGLGEGSHNLAATAKDAAGNVSAASAALAVVVDRTTPVLSITSDKTALKIGESATVTFTFSEDPGASFAWDGTTGDIAVTGGTLGPLGGAGNVRTATFTPAAGANAGAAAITVAAGAWADTAGNAAGASAAPVLAFDTLAPTLSISSDAMALRAGQGATITFTFSEDPGASFTIGDITATGGTLGELAGTGLTRTAIFTPAPGMNAGTATIGVAAGSWFDVAGNGSPDGAQVSILFDTLAPPAPSIPDLAGGSDSGASGTDNITNDTTPSFTGTAEDGATVRLYDGDIVVGTAVAAGGTWSITSGALADGTHNLAAVVTDAAGNDGPRSAALALTVDTAAPVLAISSDRGALKAGETATISFTFSEDPGDSFSAADIAVTGGTLGPLAGAGTVRTAVFTPAADTDGGTVQVTVAAGSYADSAGNAGAGAAFGGLTFDTRAPAPSAPALAAASDTGASSADRVTNAASLTFTGTVENGSTVTLVDTATNAVLGTVPAADGNWSVTLDALPEGVASIAARATDAAGNAGALSAAATVTIDRSAPAAPTLSAAGRTLTAAGLEEGATWQYSIDGGATWVNAAGPRATFSDGTYSVIARQSDVAGNASPASLPLSLTVDTQGPTSTIHLSDDDLATGETATVTVSFSEVVTGLDVGDISVENGTLSNLGTGDGGRTWTAVLTPSIGVVDEDNLISVNNAGVIDRFGNAGQGASSASYAVHTLGVGATIELSDTDLKAGETAQVTIRFTQQVRGFTLSDLEVENGKLSDLASSDGGRTWTATFTPAASITDDTNTISLDRARVFWADGSAGAGISTSANYAVSTVRPAATLSIADRVLGSGAATTVTIRFSEQVSGFSLDDLKASSGKLSGLASTDGGLTWTATLTGSANSQRAEPGYVTLDAAGVRNAGGNSGQGSVSAQFVQAPANANVGKVDGVTVITETINDPSGRPQQRITIAEASGDRAEDTATPNRELADIPITQGASPGAPPTLTASLPNGIGLQAEGPAAPLAGADALTDLIRRIEDKTASGSTTQAEMTGQGRDFLQGLGSASLQSQTITPMAAQGATPGQPIVISGAAPGQAGPGATVVGLVIDGGSLPSGSIIQLDNVEFAAVVGDLRVMGGSGRNFVVGDSASQLIYLGEDDDILGGGGGDDFVGSAGGNDRLDGGSGKDLVAGGAGNDTALGGSGDDVVLGGRSMAGSWDFYLTGTGIAARHGGAVFTVSGSEMVQAGELDAAVPELGFLKADQQKVAAIALLYAALGRAPDLGGLAFWSQDGVSLHDVAAGVLASAEFDGGALGRTDDATFVRGMYQQVLGRAPDQAGFDFWMERLAGTNGSPAARADVLVAAALSDEHRASALTADGYLIGQASVTREGGWFSGSGNDRLDGGAGNDYLVGGDGFDTAVYAGNRSQYRILIGEDLSARVQETASGEIDTIAGIESAEFRDGTLDLAFLGAEPARLQAFGMLYQAVFDRPADAAGLNWWMSAGADAAQLAQHFTGTAEFQQRYGGLGDAAFMRALYANSGLALSAAGGIQSWEAYLGQHTRAELVAAWIQNEDVIDAQFGTSGLWLV